MWPIPPRTNTYNQLTDDQKPSEVQQQLQHILSVQRIHIHIHIYIYTYIHIYIYTYTYIHIHMYIYIYTYTYIHIHIHIHIQYTYTYTYVCICIYIYVCVCLSFIYLFTPPFVCFFCTKGACNGCVYIYIYIFPYIPIPKNIRSNHILPFITIYIYNLNCHIYITISYHASLSYITIGFLVCLVYQKKNRHPLVN